MPSPPDRNNIAPPGALLEMVRPAFPLPPLNVHVNSSFEKGSFDIRWTSPSQLQPNTCFNIVGVNVYRAYNQYGPWMRLNLEPVGSLYWRDSSRIRLVMQEDVSNQFTSRGPINDPCGKYAFRTRYSPVYINPSINDTNATNLNVAVTVNGVNAYVDTIYSKPGIVELRSVPTFDVIGQNQVNAVIPTSDTDVILATYKYVENEIPSNLAQRLFYRITTIALTEEGGLLETPLDRATESNRDEIEKLDYIWTEAIRRSKWILYQGGERVKVFLQKTAGFRCGCTSDTRKQPRSDCPLCFATGFIGGYDGPYDIIVAPDNASKSVTQGVRGRTFDHTYDSWTSNEPLLSQRDFIVKQNGDRYSIGAVTLPSNRGNQLLQFFDLSHLDETNIITKVPVLDTSILISPETRYIVRGQGDATPMMTEKANIEDEREIRGKTVTSENIQY
jgi:hypothetical protein